MTTPYMTNEARALALLTGDDAGGILASALQVAGAELLSWRTRQVVPRPGRGATVVYDAQARWAPHRIAEETLVATVGEAPAGALVLDDGQDRVAVWRFPHDPRLPGLPAAYDERAVARVLEDLGLGQGRVRLHTRAYRPGRRATIEATGSRGRLFIKVIPPDGVEALHDRHRLLLESGLPVPQSLGWTPEGILVLQALPGRTLRQTLRSRAARIPTGQSILALLDRFPDELARGTAGSSWLDKAPHYAAVIGASLPSEAGRSAELAAELPNRVASDEVVPTHGDLYEKQLLVHDGEISGLLDIDTAGPGRRLDDLACIIGHLSVLAQMERGRAAAVRRAADRYTTAFEAAVSPAELRAHVAAVVLSLATGPHRVQERGWPAATRRRLDLVEDWVAASRDAAEPR